MSSTGLTIVVPGELNGQTLGDGMLARMLACACDAAAEMNVEFYLSSWDQGLEPPCCAKCAGVIYRPDMSRRQWSIDTAPVLLNRGHASCQSIAAMHTGHKRADAVRQGESRSRARERYQIVLVKQPKLGERYWHVLSVDDGEDHDSTEGMQRG